LSKRFKAKVCLERSEHPLRNYNRNALSRAYGILRVKLEIILCDGIFCISNYLVGFYCDMGFRNSKLLLVPSTVDTDRFKDRFDIPFNFDYILYCGSLTIIKDGVNILIESFARIAKHHKDIKLVLIGEADTLEDDRYFKDLVTTLNISHRVIFTGKLPRTEIPAYMCNAKILALARPKSIISDAGFPSKVTEYLASDVPVVLTNVGDISLYLKDGFNAVISDPDSVTGFTEKLDFVLNNYQYAKIISARGKELTETVFNYEFQAKRIIVFINLNLYGA
jgi:glycosyltransferase involved in cell wall biosynthesis